MTEILRQPRGMLISQTNLCERLKRDTFSHEDTPICLILYAYD